MKFQEKKYLLGSFTKVQKILEEMHANKIKEVTSTHYYAQQAGNNVTKLVKYADRTEIHILKESNGKYSLSETLPMKDIEEGFQWLKNKGFKLINEVKMNYTDYEYKNGIVGLYVLNDSIYSIILDFPEGQHEIIEKDFELSSARIISVPYNKLLEQMGRSSSRNL